MCCVDLDTEGREPPALPGHVSADRKTSLVIWFVFFFLLPHDWTISLQTHTSCTA